MTGTAQGETKIAVVSTTCLQVPPDDYGGIELMVYNLAHELGARGHDVTCIATQGTDIENVDVIETTEPDDSQDCFEREPEAFDRYADRLPEFDVVVDHSWSKLSYYGKAENPEAMADTEILGVFHGSPHPLELPPLDRTNLAAVSEASARAWDHVTDYEFRHVYNGIDVARYPLSRERGDYLMTLNRIREEKGILECIELADAHGVPTKIVGEDEFVDDHDYVLEVMNRCHSSNYAEYVGKVDQNRKVELLKGARGVVLIPQHPYREAFGLAAVEAMACGTPVLATDNAGLGEVVRTVQGTGTFAETAAVGPAMRSLLEGRGEFPAPAELRAGVREHFSKEAMTDVYLERIEEVLADGW